MPAALGDELAAVSQAHVDAAAISSKETIS
jgi:hypothetical protein